MGLAVLKITDGTIEIDLLQAASQQRHGFLVKDWTPSTSDLKQGGIWRDSPMADERSLVMSQDTNIVDTYTMTVAAKSQDALIERVRLLRQMLLKAEQYWTADWQDEPVYIEAKASCETQTRYAHIKKGRLDADGNPYAAPFLGQDNVMRDLNLAIEHGAWLSNPPGDSTCLTASALQQWDYESAWSLNAKVFDTNVESIFEMKNGYILVGANKEIYRSVDQGDNWTKVYNDAGSGIIYDFCEAGNGDVFAVDGGGQHILRSTDDGLNWASVHNAGNDTWSLTRCASGKLLCGVNGADDLKSTNDGATWSSVANGLHYCRSLFTTSSGTILAGRYNASGFSGIGRSTDEGENWTMMTLTPMQVQRFDSTPSRYGIWYGTIYAACTTTSTLYASRDDGLTWAISEAFGSAPGNGLVVCDSGMIFVGFASSDVYASADDGGFWYEETTDPANAIRGAACLGNGVVIVGSAARIWERRTFDAGDYFGQEATCQPNVYIANKHVLANITNISIWDNDAGAWLGAGANYHPITTFPFELFPDDPGQNDAVYFGIDTSLPNTGPFNSLVFDIDTAAYDANWAITWEYYDGVNWNKAIPQLRDNTDGFQEVGVNSVHWVSPADWATVNPNPGAALGVTGWFVRARISAALNNPATADVPTQQNRQIYSVITPFAEIDETYALGDIPARIRALLQVCSDEDGFSPDDIGTDRNTLKCDWIGRIIVGARSLERGANFTPYLNCSNNQLPIGLTIELHDEMSYTSANWLPMGEYATWAHSSIQDWADRISFSFTTDLAKQYRGIYKVFLRGGLNPSVTTVRAKITCGSGSPPIYSDEYTPLYGVERLYSLGNIKIPSSALLSYGGEDLEDVLTITIQTKVSLAASMSDYFYDLILMPVDEWGGDFADGAALIDSAAYANEFCDIDSVKNPKWAVRGLLRDSSASMLVKSLLEIVSNGPASIQAGASQRLWFLTAERYVCRGDHDGGDDSANLIDTDITGLGFEAYGVEVGMTVVNVTDGSSGIITEIDDDEITAQLREGTENLWDDLDIYYIITNSWISDFDTCARFRSYANFRYKSMRGET